MARTDSLTEVKRGIGVTCPCGKSARITARGLTLCYECFDRNIGYILNERYVTNECANVSANLIECETTRS